MKNGREGGEKRRETSSKVSIRSRDSLAHRPRGFPLCSLREGGLKRRSLRGKLLLRLLNVRRITVASTCDGWTRMEGRGKGSRDFSGFKMRNITESTPAELPRLPACIASYIGIYLFN